MLARIIIGVIIGALIPIGMLRDEANGEGNGLITAIAGTFMLPESVANLSAINYNHMIY